VTLIFTDTHAQLNGHPEHCVRSYFEQLTISAHKRGFETFLLSKLVQSVDVRADQAHAPVDVPAELLSMLCASAAKWFRGVGTVEQGAVRYYQANMLEKQVVERAFPRSIFITFNGSDVRRLLPDRLPIFYMYSLRHGVCDKPWFLASDCVSGDAPENVRHLETVHSR